MNLYSKRVAVNDFGSKIKFFNFFPWSPLGEVKKSKIYHQWHTVSCKHNERREL